MVEVASSNLAGPTKHKTLAHRAGVLCLDRGYPDGSNWRSGSTNSDHRRNLDARVKRRRPEGVTTREAIALCSIRLVLPNTTDPALCRVFRIWPSASWGFELEVRTNATLGAFDTERPWREAHRDETGLSLFRVIRLVLPNLGDCLVDQFSADVQNMGGGRWDTSTLIQRLRRL